ncbi:DUF1800 domain-containing protein [Membranihabitans marinus]|uniref:DUF1800 domain-containing protein n=1 Tax=Membranihabitans marinus TaxID=1227546 RepID=UPI001F2B83B7|nr:DUF1800 family protein [Membranihabitans marinus]
MNSLNPYTDILTPTLTRHLLNRTVLGYSKTQYEQVQSESLSNVITYLLRDLNPPSPPINYDYPDDIHVPIGETWIDAPYDKDNFNKIYNYRNRSLVTTVIQYLMTEQNSIYPKMILFWHNHFVTSEIQDPRFNFNYFMTLHQHALGNFKEFTKAMIINPSMLRYLNGNQNTATNPNENFARELLELFTIGKGPIVSDGDYTHYTEEDVVSIAKALTGWRDIGYRSIENTVADSYFRTFYHDKSDKVLSHRFDNQTISNEEEKEYKTVVDIIFAKKEVARFICRKFYRYFIDSTIDESVENNVITPLADIMYDADYEIKPVLAALLNSQAFIDENKVGAIIKNPIEFLLPFLKHSNITIEPVHNISRQRYWYLWQLTEHLGMGIFKVPSVSGWKAYYQEPTWYKNWINTTTLKDRYAVAVSYLERRTNFSKDIGSNIIDYISQLNSPEFPGELVRELSELMLPKTLTDEQIQALKESFIPGLPDYEWTIEYQQYLDNPNDEDLKNALNSKLKLLIYNIVSLPDYQII